MSAVSRRRFITTATALTLAAPSIVRAQEHVLRVSHFGGPYARLEELVGAPFKAATGATVRYEPGGSAVIIAKLAASRSDPAFDVVMTSDFATPEAVKQGLIAPLDAARIPNLKQVHPELIAPDRSGVGFIVDSFDVMFNREKVTRPVAAWQDLWDHPDLDRRIAMPSSGLVTFQFIVAHLATLLGSKERPNVDEAFRRLKDLRRRVRTFLPDPAQFNQYLQQGEVLAAPQYSIRILALQKSFAAAGKASAREGMPATTYNLSAVASSRAGELASRYIDFCLARETQERLVQAYLFTPAHREAAVPKEHEQALRFSNLRFIDLAFIAASKAEWTRRWQREVEA